MKCERCHEHAATQAIRAEKNGQPCELFVCDGCARESAKPSGPVSLADILFSLGAPEPATPSSTPGPGTAESAVATPSPGEVCHACGMTRDALRDRRRFGCPACYEAFPEEVRALLRELQYGDRHVGRTPRKAALRRHLRALETNLADAIVAQRYEEAARLRDEIKALEAGTVGGKESTDGEA